jgi:pseudouridine-5'-phosphate glycosidase
MNGIDLSPEIADALRARQPIVALETAVVTAGLPRDAALTAASSMMNAVREAGAVPAVTAVVAGVLRIGLSDDEVETLADTGRGGKVSVSNLAAVLAKGGTAGTTVSATLAACGLTGGRHIHVMATGGIGGVHRGWTRRPDVSPDLTELARSEVCVVCAGAKSVLDIEATVETLETLGVPVVGYGTDRFPTFYSSDDPDAPVVERVDDAGSAASVCRRHWDVARRRSGVVLARPVPDDAALPAAEVARHLEEAEAAAEAAGIRRQAITPFLLDRLAAATEGRTLDANLALLERNAALAGAVAVRLSPG